MNFETLRGAYGRDYRRKLKVLEDWIAGKDFQCCWCHRYCSNRDFKRDVTVRYNKNRSVVIIKYRNADGTWYI